MHHHRMTRTFTLHRRNHGFAILVALLSAQAIGLTRIMGLPITGPTPLQMTGTPALLLGLGVCALVYGLVMTGLSRTQ